MKNEKFMQKRLWKYVHVNSTSQTVVKLEQKWAGQQQSITCAESAIIPAIYLFAKSIPHQKIKMKLTPHHFFTDFFPNTYVCATSDSNAQFDGVVVEPGKTPEYYQNFLRIFQDLNKQGHNIFFTPNGVKTPEGKNRLDNVAKINAWWIDCDINETKTASDPETQKLRERIKAEWRGQLFFPADAMAIKPSLTVETRNGFQLYWFAEEAAIQLNWLTIAESIYDKFKEMGADHSTVKPAQLMRLPFFWYFKKGEQGKIEIDPFLSTYKKHTEAEMQTYFKPVAVDPLTLPKKPLIYKPQYVSTHTGNDIFMKVQNMPVDEVLQKLSGHWLVNHEKITVQKMDTQKSNILVDGRGTPNFIDREKNHLYSHNSPGCTVIGFLQWYARKNGYREGRISQGLKELFNS